ncbi:3-hydroxy-3-methylglutaryl CoA synthase [Rhizorhabdus wittichii DC-6]|nr:3-hydroxy-3-methylglutaryl CoA synthase [Rhizorhabdus wittichii DC-6]
MAGIHAFGGYVPRQRLQREAVHAATGWFAPGLKAFANGERSFCAWDEDAVTMAVEAARDCLAGRDRSAIARVVLASTSHPFADRQNSTIVKEALLLPDATAALDVAGSKRAATSALIDAFHAVAGDAGDTLCIASERNLHRPGSEGEFHSGHAAASVVVAKGDGCARLIGSHSVSIDFVDHFRREGEAFDYHWESRWVREEGYGGIVVSAIVEALRKLGIDGGTIDHFALGSPMPKIAEQVAQRAGIRREAVADTLAGLLGDAGAAQPLVLLSHVLERATPGQLIMVVGFGGGCDVIVLETTAAIVEVAPARGIGGYLAEACAVDNYVRYLAQTGLLELDKGMRAELDEKPILTAQYRERKSVLGLVGGKCTRTGTVQFPKSPISVSREARAIDSQEDYPLADLPARIATFTADHLMFSPSPPVYYGNIEFVGGGCMLAEIVDVGEEGLEVGMPLRMVFRIKAIDQRRGFSQYFWKAVPERRPASRS